MVGSSAATQGVHRCLRGLGVRSQLHRLRLHGGLQAAQDPRLRGLRVQALLQDRAHHRDLPRDDVRTLQRGVRWTRRGVCFFVLCVRCMLWLDVVGCAGWGFPTAGGGGGLGSKYGGRERISRTGYRRADHDPSGCSPLYRRNKSCCLRYPHPRSLHTPVEWISRPVWGGGGHLPSPRRSPRLACFPKLEHVSYFLTLSRYNPI